ncbi:MAG: HAMP domain-containing sensor histidine kinase [Bacteroidaceae bacterium]
MDKKGLFIYKMGTRPMNIGIVLTVLTFCVLMSLLHHAGKKGDHVYAVVDSVHMAILEGDSVYQAEKERLLSASNNSNDYDTISFYGRKLFQLGLEHDDPTTQLKAISALYRVEPIDSVYAYIELLSTIPDIPTQRIFATTFGLVSNSIRTDRFLKLGEAGKDSLLKDSYRFVQGAEKAYADSLTTDTLGYYLDNFYYHMSLLYSCPNLSRESPFYHYLEQFSKVVDKMPESLMLLKDNFWMLESDISTQAKDAHRSIEAAEKVIHFTLDINDKPSLVDYGNSSSLLNQQYLYLMAISQLFWSDLLPDSIINRNVTYLHTPGGKLGAKLYYGTEESMTDSIIYAYVAGKKELVVDIAEGMIASGDTLDMTLYDIIRIENKALNQYTNLSYEAKIALRNANKINGIFLGQLARGENDFSMLTSLQTQFRKNAELELKSEQENTRMLYLLIGVSILVLLLLAVMLVITLHNKRKISEARAEADRLRKNAEHAKDIQNYFMHNMNHEIRTPINAIVGFSDLLVEDDNLSESDRKDFGETIKKSGQMLIQIIDDVLDIARLESGQYELVYENIVLNKLGHQVLETISYRVPEGIELRFESDFSDDFVYSTDARRMEQILLNYLSNACKHIQKGYILLEMRRSGDKVVFIETNTGQRVPEAKVPFLFQRFSKLNSYSQGTGLGLNICYKLAELMGGRVYYDETFTEGARFVCELPLNRPAKSK